MADTMMKVGNMSPTQMLDRVTGLCEEMSGKPDQAVNSHRLQIAKSNMAFNIHTNDTLVKEAMYSLIDYAVINRQDDLYRLLTADVPAKTAKVVYPVLGCMLGRE